LTYLSPKLLIQVSDWEQSHF